MNLDLVHVETDGLKKSYIPFLRLTTWLMVSVYDVHTAKMLSFNIPFTFRNEVRCDCCRLTNLTFVGIISFFRNFLFQYCNYDIEL